MTRESPDGPASRSWSPGLLATDPGRRPARAWEAIGVTRGGAADPWRARRRERAARQRARGGRAGADAVRRGAPRPATRSTIAVARGGRSAAWSSRDRRGRAAGAAMRARRGPDALVPRWAGSGRGPAGAGSAPTSPCPAGSTCRWSSDRGPRRSGPGSAALDGRALRPGDVSRRRPTRSSERPPARWPGATALAWRPTPIRVLVGAARRRARAGTRLGRPAGAVPGRWARPATAWGSAWPASRSPGRQARRRGLVRRPHGHRPAPAGRDARSSCWWTTSRPAATRSPARGHHGGPRDAGPARGRAIPSRSTLVGETEAARRAAPARRPTRRALAHLREAAGWDALWHGAGG